MAAYYTDAYNNAVMPDSDVPAGQVLTQFTSFVGVTGNHGQTDTFYLFKLPKGAILKNLTLSGPAIASGTLHAGTSAEVYTPDASADLYLPVAAGAATIIDGAAVTGAWKMDLNGGYQGTTAIVQTCLNGTVRAGSKMMETTGIYLTFETTVISANMVLFAQVDYYMPGGADVVYDPG
jgi:hypothetical protein